MIIVLYFSEIFKGYMRNLGRIKFKQFSKSEIIIENNGALYGDGERDDERGIYVLPMLWSIYSYVHKLIKIFPTTD